jgi:hypothetical protein
MKAIHILFAVAYCGGIAATRLITNKPQNIEAYFYLLFFVVAYYFVDNFRFTRKK